jgi:hypothetical protein
VFFYNERSTTATPYDHTTFERWGLWGGFGGGSACAGPGITNLTLYTNSEGSNSLQNFREGDSILTFSTKWKRNYIIYVTKYSWYGRRPACQFFALQPEANLRILKKQPQA